jgi:SpoVK/Ycf46/Vps4 family AAA+-type ATPase
VSDILSMWVGVAEKNIAEAFDEAARDDAILLFDEADSFLQDRRGAVRSWEVTQVNEFLQQLEAHRGIVACTTNLFKNLDQASLRRFTFKVEFRFLDAARARSLFRAYFGSLTEEVVSDDWPAHEAARPVRYSPDDGEGPERPTSGSAWPPAGGRPTAVVPGDPRGARTDGRLHRLSVGGAA